MQVFCNVYIWHPAVFKCLEVRLLETLLALALFENWGCIVVCSTPHFLLVPVDNKRHNLQQNDITGHYGPSISSPFSPTPTFRVSRWTAGQPIGQPFLSMGTQLHYRDELSYCEDPTAPSCRSGWSHAGHWGIMRWPGFRGHFTHCLESISRNASLDDCRPFSADSPHTATPSPSVLNILGHLWTVYVNVTFFFSNLYWKSKLLQMILKYLQSLMMFDFDFILLCDPCCTDTGWKEFERSFIYWLRLNLMSLMVVCLKTNSWPWSQLCGKEDNFFLRRVHCQALPALSTMCGKSILFAKKAEDRQNFSGRHLGGQFLKCQVCWSVFDWLLEEAAIFSCGGNHSWMSL